MSTLWTFGDSFTYGSGYNFNLEFKMLPQGIKEMWEYGTKKEKVNAVVEYLPHMLPIRELLLQEGVRLWPEIIQQAIGATDLKNYGKPGASNLNILKELTGCLLDIKSGDTVVIGTTRGNRLDVPIPLGFSRTNTSQIVTCAGLDVAFAHKDDKSTNDHYDFSKFTEEQYRSIVDYRYNVLTKEGGYVLELYNKNILLNIAKLLIGNNIRMYVWDSTLWTQFESIDKATNGRIRDGHWSFEGYTQFSKFLLSCMESNDIDINSELHSNWLVNNKAIL